MFLSRIMQCLHPCSERRLIDIDQRGAEHRGGSDIGCRVERHIGARGQSPDGQSPREPLFVRERGKEEAFATLGVYVGDRNRNREVLTRYVNHGGVGGTDGTFNAEKLRTILSLWHALNS